MSSAIAAEYGPHTVDDYLALGEDTDQRHELINGWIVVAPSAAPTHNSVGIALMSALRARLPEGYATNYDVDVVMPDRRQCLRPDVIVAAKAQAVSLRPIPASEVLLAVEIVSPGSKRTDQQTKPRIYAAAGIQSYWLVETGSFSVTQFRLAGRWYEEVQRVAGDEIVVSQPFEMAVDLREALEVTVLAAKQHRTHRTSR